MPSNARYTDIYDKLLAQHRVEVMIPEVTVTVFPNGKSRYREAHNTMNAIRLWAKSCERHVKMKFYSESGLLTVELLD